MPASLEGQLVVAISSRALFDFEEENQLFEAGDDQAYMQLQLQRLDRPVLMLLRAAEGVGLLLIEHKRQIAWRLAQRVFVLGQGRIVFDGNPQELDQSPRTRQQWLEA